MAVYLIQAGAFGQIKIGSAADPLARMRQLQTSMPKRLRLARVLEGDVAEERELHQRFAADRLTGEWFRYSTSMLTDDLGLRDLEIPRAKRPPYANRRDLKTATGRWHQLRDDLQELIGGTDALAKALGIPPWGTGWQNERKHLPALVVLARQAGAPVTLTDAQRAMSDAEVEEAEAAKARQEAQDAKYQSQWESDWVAKHGAASAWWPLLAQAPQSDDAEPAEAAA